MQQYFELVDSQGLKLPSAERSQRDSLKSFERSVEVWKDWIRLKKDLATLGEELNMWNSLSCLLTLLASFDKNNPEMGIDSVARQMHQKTVQHYWVNIVKQQVTGGGVSHI